MSRDIYYENLDGRKISPLMRDKKTYEGVLVVDKESGPTSHDIVAVLRCMLRMRRIGHCGTLDPLATGVLVVCLGNYTRLSEWLTGVEKEYRATFLLGATSDTGDAGGEIIVRESSHVPDLKELEAAVGSFRGEIAQIPPAYSAIKIDGVRSYKRARRRENVRLPARRVLISRLEILEYDYPRLQVKIVCSKGTYVRSLAVDLGEKLGCGAYVEQLRRTRSGSLDLAHALSLADLERVVHQGELDDHLVPISRALHETPVINLDTAALRAFCNGNTVTIEADIDFEEWDICLVNDLEDEFHGIGEWDVKTGQLKPKKVLKRPRSVLIDELCTP